MLHLVSSGQLQYYIACCQNEEYGIKGKNEKSGTMPKTRNPGGSCPEREIGDAR